jgi:hypothetical protein
MKCFLWSAVLFFCVQAYAAPVCVSGNSLAAYEALGSGGCTVGGSIIVKDFVFSVISFGGGAIPVADTGITVTTQFLRDGFGLRFASNGFQVSGAGFANYLIGFTWDPTADIRGAADILDPGTVDIVTNLCVDVGFRQSVCVGTPFSLHVFEGATSQLTDSVTFAPTAILGVRNNISLNANGGSAGFDSIENDITVPEPGTLFGLAAGLAILARARRKARHFALQHDAEFGRPASGHSCG